MDIAALAAELTAGHPDTGAYNADSSLAADQLNTVNRTRNLSSLSGDAMFAATTVHWPRDDSATTHGTFSMDIQALKSELTSGQSGFDIHHKRRGVTR